MKISIYTSAYNAEKYVAKCIESVLNQTFTDFEYWVVDNGSTDNTRQILQHYSSLDSRIKLVCLDENDTWFRANMIQKMNGEYYTVLDADDWIEPDYMEHLLKISDKVNADIVCTGSHVHVGKNNSTYELSSPDVKIVTCDNMDRYFFEIHWFFRHVWGMLVKTEVAKSGYVPDTDKIGIYYGGDTLCSFELVKISKVIYIDNSVLHNYRQHDKSISHQYDSRQSKSDIYLYNYFIDFLKEYHASNAVNINFLRIVYLNAVVDTISNLETAYITDEEKLSEILTIMRREVTHSLFTLTDYDCDIITSYLGKKNLEYVVKGKRTLLRAYLKYGFETELSSDEMLSILSWYSPTCGSAIEKDNIALFLMNDTLFTALVNNDYITIIKEVARCIKDDQYVKKYDMVKIIKKVEDNNKLVLKITNSHFIRKYYDIYMLIVSGDYSNAVHMCRNIVSVKRYDISEEIIWLYSTLSALLENVDEYINSKFSAVEFHYQNKQYNECRSEINDLAEMGVECSSEILRIKEAIEAIEN